MITAIDRKPGEGMTFALRSDAHSYLWRQVFFTEPVGQWLCVAAHSCRWSIARSDAGVMGRVERRRAAISKGQSL